MVKDGGVADNGSVTSEFGRSHACACVNGRETEEAKRDREIEREREKAETEQRQRMGVPRNSHVKRCNGQMLSGVKQGQSKRAAGFDAVITSVGFVGPSGGSKGRRGCRARTSRPATNKTTVGKRLIRRGYCTLLQVVGAAADEQRLR